jgi:hypothetical protein
MNVNFVTLSFLPGRHFAVVEGKIVALVAKPHQISSLSAAMYQVFETSQETIVFPDVLKCSIRYTI